MPFRKYFRNIFYCKILKVFTSSYIYFTEILPEIVKFLDNNLVVKTIQGGLKLLLWVNLSLYVIIQKKYI